MLRSGVAHAERCSGTALRVGDPGGTRTHNQRIRVQSRSIHGRPARSKYACFMAFSSAPSSANVRRGTRSSTRLAVNLAINSQGGGWAASHVAAAGRLSADALDSAVAAPTDRHACATLLNRGESCCPVPSAEQSIRPHDAASLTHRPPGDERVAPSFLLKWVGAWSRSIRKGSRSAVRQLGARSAALARAARRAPAAPEPPAHRGRTTWRRGDFGRRHHDAPKSAPHAGGVG
jgi:hypothetical protein